MKIFIEAERTNYGCSTKKNRRDSEVGFRQLGYNVHLFLPGSLKHIKDLDAIFHASIKISKEIWLEKGFKNTDLPYHPAELQPLIGRIVEDLPIKIVRQKIESGRTLFIKPHWTDRKAFTAQVINNTNIDIFKQPDNTKVTISTRANFTSEWRLFILEGKIIGAQYYKGDFTKFPFSEPEDYTLISHVIKHAKNLPVAYCADFGRTPFGIWQLIECNEILFANSFGLLPQKFAEMIKARWGEISS